MALRFRRSIKIFPGFRVNFGKSGITSASIGGRGATMTFGKNGIYSNVGLPGTGLSYRSKLSGNSQRRNYDLPYKANLPNEITDGKKEVEFEIMDDGNVQVRDEYGNVLPPKYVKIAREQNKAVIDKYVNDKCNDLNSDVDKVLHIHMSTQSPDISITFKEEPFDIPKPEINLPLPPQFITIGFLDKIFGYRKKRIDEKNECLRNTYEKEIQEAHHEHEIALKAWESQKEEFTNIQRDKAYIINKGRYDNLESMSLFLEEHLKEICWPRETLITFDIQNNGKKIMIDVDLPEIEDMPKKIVSVAATGVKLNIKDRTATQSRKDYMIHIHGIGFIVIGETFRALPMLEEIVLSGYSQRLDSGSGNISDEYLHSVRVKREQWMLLNFNHLSQIDVVKCLGEFEIERNMTSTGIFKPIIPFEN